MTEGDWGGVVTSEHRYDADVACAAVNAVQEGNILSRDAAGARQKSSPGKTRMRSNQQAAGVTSPDAHHSTGCWRTRAGDITSGPAGR